MGRKRRRGGEGRTIFLFSEVGGKERSKVLGKGEGREMLFLPSMLPGKKRKKGEG